jgi:hypothetical protein
MFLPSPFQRPLNGGGLNDTLGNSEGSPTSSRREGKERSRYLIRHDKYYMVGGDLFVLVRTFLIVQCPRR